MTFEDDFPSLKGKVQFGLHPSVKMTDVIISTEELAVHTTTDILRENCLDKQRVKEALDKAHNQYSSVLGSAIVIHSLRKELDL